MSDMALLTSNNDKRITLDTNIKTDRPLTVSLSNNSGDVTVTTGDGDSVHIDVQEISRKNSDVALKDAVLIEITDNDIVVRPNLNIASTVQDFARRVRDQLKDGFDAKMWDFKGIKAANDIVFDIRVTVPRTLAPGSKLTMRTASGDVRSEGFSGDVSSATASGDHANSNVGGNATSTTASGNIRLQGVGGNVEGNSASGDVVVSDIRGWIAARSVSGDVRVTNATIKGGRFNSVSGDVSVDGTLTNATTYSTETVSGSVRFSLTVPAEGAQLTFRSLSGSSNVGGDWRRGESKRSWVIGEGTGPDLRVKSVSGSLFAEGRVDPSLNLIHESRGQSTADETSDKGAAATPDQGHAHEHAPHMSHGDVDWDHARTWIKDVTDKVTRFVTDLDAAGDKRRDAQQTEPINVESQTSASQAAETQPVERTTPYAPMSNDPVAPYGSTVPETPVVPTPAEAQAAPETAAAQTPDVPPMPETPPAPDAPQAPSRENRRLELLQAVQRGEMTVDEALRQLDGDNS